MQKLISILLAAIFAGVTLNAVAADAPKTPAVKRVRKAPTPASGA